MYLKINFKTNQCAPKEIKPCLLKSLFPSYYNTRLFTGNVSSQVWRNHLVMLIYKLHLMSFWVTAWYVGALFSGQFQFDREDRSVSVSRRGGLRSEKYKEISSTTWMGGKYNHINKSIPLIFFIVRLYRYSQFAHLVQHTFFSMNYPLSRHFRSTIIPKY